MRPRHSSSGLSLASHRCGPGFETGPRHVGFVVGQSDAGQVFSEYFGFPCNRRSLHQLLHNHPHVSSGECRIGQCVAAVLGIIRT
jgi:hypothetical protein